MPEDPTFPKDSVNLTQKSVFEAYGATPSQAMAALQSTAFRLSNVSVSTPIDLPVSDAPLAPTVTSQDSFSPNAFASGQAVAAQSPQPSLDNGYSPLNVNFVEGGIYTVRVMPAGPPIF